MRLLDISVYTKRNRRVPGQYLIARCGRRFVDIRFARHLPWEQHLFAHPLLCKKTKDGWKFAVDYVGFHLRVTYHWTSHFPEKR